MKTATVQTIDYGMLPVHWQDGKMVPISGAATLEAYRENGDLIPPWILSRDLAPGLDWDEIMIAMEDKNESKNSRVT